MVRQGAQLVWCGNAFRNNLNHINDSLYIDNILVFNQHIEIEVVFLSFFFLSFCLISHHFLSAEFFKDDWIDYFLNPRGWKIIIFPSGFFYRFKNIFPVFRFLSRVTKTLSPRENERTWTSNLFGIIYRAMRVDVFILFCLILLNIRSLHEVLQQWFLLIFVYFTWNEYNTIKIFKIYLYNFK